MLKIDKPRSGRVLRNSIIVMLGIALTSMSFAGCSRASNDADAIRGRVKADAEYEYLSERVSEVDDAVRRSVMSFNALGVELMKALAEADSEKNLLLSPTSLSFALAMVQNGAEGETKSQILGVLGEDEAGINERYNIFMNYLNTLDADEASDTPGIKMKVANSLWFKEELVPKQDFVNTLSSFYMAQVYRQDFSDEKTVERMNAWVENQTNGLLKQTIDEISTETIAFLMNTVYFKGTWRHEFAEQATVEEVFLKAGDEPVLTDMMHKTETMPYYEDELCQSTSLSYYGGTSMAVFLPKGDLNDFLSVVDYDYLQKCIDEGRNQYQLLELSFPKLDYEARNNLKDLLIDRGMVRPFAPFEAEFDQMIEIKNENVYLSSIFQNARIVLDEKGTEAAAVTVVEMETTSAMPSEPVEFKCDKPFLYIIRENDSSAVLFIGLVREP